jgi:hypothetical protein
MRFGFYETCFDIGLLGSPLCGAAVAYFRWRLGLGCLEPFDALRLLWNLFSHWSISTPLCGAAVTFFAAAKKVTKESSYGVSGIRT